MTETSEVSDASSSKATGPRNAPWLFFVVVLVVLSVVAGYYANEKRREAARAQQLETEATRCKTALSDRQSELEVLQRTLASVQSEASRFRSERDEVTQKLNQLRDAGARKGSQRPAVAAPAPPVAKPAGKAATPTPQRPRTPPKAPAPKPAAPKKR